jgi:succinate dehydrogenase / fumarate reductase cytochrome b subunit
LFAVIAKLQSSYTFHESVPMTELAKKRPEFRNINALTDLPSYRLPAAGMVSILHRISGVLMFLLMPFIIWMFDTSVSSEISFAKFKAAFNRRPWACSGLVHQAGGLGPDLGLPAPLLRRPAPPVDGREPHAVSKEFGKSSAVTTLAVSIGLTVVLGAKLFGLY